jgi:hypothetical protein
MNEPAPIIDHESRWAPALSIFVVLVMLTVLPDHVHVLPAWVVRLLVISILAVMLAVGFTKGNTLWLKIERAMIIVIAGLYVVNTIVELVDMVGLVTLHPGSANAFSLLSSSVAIWMANVLTFSLLYWQIDRGGPYARTCKLHVRPDWVFPPPPSPEDLPPGWRPLFLDYLFLGYNTATAFSPTDAAPLTRRAKMLMMIESTISLLTMVVVLSRAINVIPS